jgi:hypothetical protein
MTPAGVCLILPILVFYALGAVIEPQSFVPISAHPIEGSNFGTRDLRRGRGDVFKPREKVELLYTQRMYAHIYTPTLSGGTF